MLPRIMVMLLAGALVGAIPTDAEADQRDKGEKKEKKEKRQDLKSVTCPPECGFMVRTHDEEELVTLVQEHARTYHGMEMSEDEVKAIMKDARKTKEKKEKKKEKKDKDKDKERERRY